MPQQLSEHQVQCSLLYKPKILMAIKVALELARLYSVLITLRGWAREELVSTCKTSQFKPVLLQICDYRPLSVKIWLFAPNLAL